MTEGAARWARIEALFDAALEQPPAARAEWVGAAAGDPALRDEVMAMLAAHEQLGGVLDRPLPVPVIPAGIPAGFARAIAARYVLAEPIGEGGMANVILAHDRSRDQPVVIKVLKPEIAAWFGPDRFRTEVELAARLSHPRILGLIDSGESDEFLYYVMPYLGGETLRSRLQRQGRLSPAEAIGLLRDLAGALAYAHRDAGVVHRDLKPENVLCAGGHALLMDFGIARLASASLGKRTAAGVILGTPGYMAPEQQNGRTVDHRADLWAWGLLAKEMLEGNRAAVTLLARPDVPLWLANLVEQCLALDPDARPESADVLQRVLSALTPSF